MPEAKKTKAELLVQVRELRERNARLEQLVASCGDVENIQERACLGIADSRPERQAEFSRMIAKPHESSQRSCLRTTVEALSRARGNKQRASRLLRVSRFVLRRQMKTLNIAVPK